MTELLNIVVLGIKYGLIASAVFWPLALVFYVIPAAAIQVHKDRATPKPRALTPAEVFTGGGPKL